MAAGKEESWAKAPYSIHREGLGPWARWVYTVLLDEARRTGSATVKTGLRRVAVTLGTTRATVSRATLELESHGLIKIPRVEKGARSLFEVLKLPGESGIAAAPLPKKRVASQRSHRVASQQRQGGIAAAPQVASERCQDNRESLSREDRVAAVPRERKPRAHCEVWDTLCELFEGVVDPVEDAKRIGLIRKRLIAKGATAEQMKIRAERYKRTWPDMEFTPEALNKHWKRFENDSSTANRPGRVEAPAGKYARENLNLFGEP